MDENSKKEDKKLKTCKSRRETAVQGTNDSSIVSKCSMANVGYFSDIYLQEFVSKVARRAPLIHRGYYIRAKTIDYIYRKFLLSNKGHKQIISLGAGFDSAYFRMKAEDLLDDVSFFEVDFPDVVRRKAAIIQSKDVLRNLIPDYDSQPNDRNPLIEIYTKGYTLLGVDLTQLNTLEALLLHCGADVDTPTLLLSECVLTYMTRRCSSEVIHWAAETFTNAVFVLYEQIHPNDAFGLFMQKHFQIIGSPLKCINAFPTLQSQVDRFIKQGWKKTEAMDMNQFYHLLVGKEEHLVLEYLEPFDEYEEWHLKCAHYMVLCGYLGTCPELLNDFKRSPTNPCLVGSSDSLTPVSFSPVLAPPQVLRFGHESACLHGNKHMVTLGGFGEQGGKHRRLIDVSVTDLVTMETAVIFPEVDYKTLEVSRMHHAMGVLSDNTVLLFGGRTSPIKLCSQLLRIHLKHSPINQSDARTEPLKPDQAVNASENIVKDSTTSQSESRKIVENVDSRHCDDTNSRRSDVDDTMSNLGNSSVLNKSCDKEIVSKTVADKENCRHGDEKKNSVNSQYWTAEFSVMVQSGDVPCPRWRHTATTIKHHGKEHVLVYGGRTDKQLALNDAYLLDTETCVWKKLNTSDSVPGHRHTHSTATDGHVIFVSGGLDLDLQPLSSISTYNIETSVWQHLSVKGKVLKRYSHTSHVIDDLLILIGGVNVNNPPPGVAIIHIPTCQCLEFPLPEQKVDSLMMLHRHTSTYLGDHKFLIIGGGGNCFSFGTHLNVTPVILDLSDCIKQASRHFNQNI